MFNLRDTFDGAACTAACGDTAISCSARATKSRKLASAVATYFPISWNGYAVRNAKISARSANATGDVVFNTLPERPGDGDPPEPKVLAWSWMSCANRGCKYESQASPSRPKGTKTKRSLQRGGVTR